MKIFIVFKLEFRGNRALALKKYCHEMEHYSEIQIKYNDIFFEFEVSDTKKNSIINAYTSTLNEIAEDCGIVLEKCKGKNCNKTEIENLGNNYYKVRGKISLIENREMAGSKFIFVTMPGVKIYFSNKFINNHSELLKKITESDDDNIIHCCN